MVPTFFSGEKFILHSPELGQLQAFPNLHIVGVEAQQAADHRFVGTMAPVGVGKGAIKGDFRLFHFFTQNGAAGQAQPYRSCGVGAGGPYGDGP